MQVSTRTRAFEVYADLNILKGLHTPPMHSNNCLDLFSQSEAMRVDQSHVQISAPSRRKPHGIQLWDPTRQKGPLSVRRSSRQSHESGGASHPSSCPCAQCRLRRQHSLCSGPLGVHRPSPMKADTLYLVVHDSRTYKVRGGILLQRSTGERCGRAPCICLSRRTQSQWCSTRACPRGGQRTSR